MLLYPLLCSRGLLLLSVKRAIKQRANHFCKCHHTGTAQYLIGTSVRFSHSIPRSADRMSRPEGIRATYDFGFVSPAQICGEASHLIERARAICDKIGSVKEDSVSFDNVVKPLADLETEMLTVGTPLVFPKHVATDKELRAASTVAETKIDEFDVELSMRADIYNNLIAFKRKINPETVSKETLRFINKWIKDGERNGLHLSTDVQKQIKDIKKRMSELSIEFQTNLNEDTTELWFTEQELAGMPDDFIKSLDKDDNGKLKVTLKYPHLFPITRKCRVPETRKALETSYQSLCMELNTKILEELLGLRHKQATLLKYPNHAAYIQELRMAKCPENVSKFLSELAEKLQPLWEKESDVMTNLKMKECDQLGIKGSRELNFWDYRYYMAMVEEKMYSVDQNKLREYFPIDVVTAGLLEIYQQMLSLKFTEVMDGEKWHSDVRLFEVKDTATGDLQGYFYLDLYPRDGKYGHACVVPLQPGCTDASGKFQVPVAAMLANFTKPTAEKPSLLDHKEVEVFFHEFGHVMHHLCSRITYAHFANMQVERDFVEAPSQMLENWVWEAEPLRKMSRHYADGSPLPDDLLECLVQSRKANVAGMTLRQIVLSTFDQEIHKREKSDTAKIFAETYKRILKIDTIPGTNMAAGFSHLAGGYDAQYYGYLWSQVFSMDMFMTCFKKNGVMNPDIGMKYRKMILEPGGSEDANNMLLNFLGREPSQDAFLENKGLL